MPPFGPINRRRLVAVLRAAGFDGPFAGGRHEFMLKGTQRVIPPNPHAGYIGRALLARILDQADISRDEWEQLEG